MSVDLLADFLPVLVDRVASGDRLPSSALAGYGKAGRAAATSGVALRALLDLYLSAAWRLWRHLPVVADAAGGSAAVVDAGELMLRAVDDVVAVLTEGYQLARRDLVSAQATERRESHRRVFTNAAVVGVLATAAKLAGAAKVIVTARYFGAGALRPEEQ